MCDSYYKPGNKKVFHKIFINLIELIRLTVSPPCCSVQMVAQAIRVPLNPKLVNVQNKKHLTLEFLKINPQHTIPTFIDPDGFVI